MKIITKIINNTVQKRTYRKIQYLDGRGNNYSLLAKNKIYSLRNSVFIALKFPLPSRLFVTSIDILSTL